VFRPLNSDCGAGPAEHWLHWGDNLQFFSVFVLHGRLEDEEAVWLWNPFFTDSTLFTPKIWSKMINFFDKAQWLGRWGCNRKNFLGQLIRFCQILANLGTFRKNWGEIWAKVNRFGQIWLDLDKIKILHPQTHSMSYGHDKAWPMKSYFSIH